MVFLDRGPLIRCAVDDVDESAGASLTQQTAQEWVGGSLARLAIWSRQPANCRYFSASWRCIAFSASSGVTDARLEAKTLYLARDDLMQQSQV
jgi:hypothetical protein